MQVDDLEQVMLLEQVSFAAPWPESAYRYELTQNDLASYLVVSPDVRSVAWRQRSHADLRPPILAYGGLWLLVDEAHISTIASHPDWRGHGLGELLLVGLLDVAVMRQAVEATLEVRVSNLVAQNLYRKYHFDLVGRRKGYYHDNDEDALIMTTPPLQDADWQLEFAALKAALHRRLCAADVLAG